ncbi:MAG: glycine betaine ABC transporter substrate-binding protein [Rhodococcus sp. (in: high G+C Gram-positive bacteria)]|uniref:glycine betaine ABC transporter substrate-binding protein n=1 Tax=Rhodococcus sp. TaxID=1831 RepID=UPI003BB750A0
MSPTSGIAPNAPDGARTKASGPGRSALPGVREDDTVTVNAVTVNAVITDAVTTDAVTTDAVTTDAGRAGRRGVILVAAAALTSLAACASPVLDDAPGPSGVVVGADAGADSALVAHLYAGALRRTGIDVTVREQDDRAASLIALDSAEVTLVPGYTGRLLRYFEPTAPQTGAEDVFAALGRALPADLTVSDYASAQDRAVLVLSEATAAAIGAGDLDTIAGHCADMTVAATPAFVESGGLDGLDTIGCVPGAVEHLTDDEAVRAVTDRGALGALTTASPALTGADVVVLADVPDRSRGADETDAGTPAPVFAAQNVVPLFRQGALDERQLDALSVIAGELTTADLAEMRGRVDGGEDSAAVADDWLGDHS